MKTYLRALVNWEQNNQAKLWLIAEFEYNNTRNISTSNTFFDHNYNYYPLVFCEDKTDSYSKSRSANKLAKELKHLIEIYQQNLLHIQYFQKRAYNKRVKPSSYTIGKKVWLNNKYIRTKQNQKPKVQFFGFFQVLYLVKKQAYKLELLAH